MYNKSLYYIYIHYDVCTWNYYSWVWYVFFSNFKKTSWRIQARTWPVFPRWSCLQCLSGKRKSKIHHSDADACIYIYTYGYGSIPINTIFRGMNIHLPAILMFTRGTRFWPIPIYIYIITQFCADDNVIWIYWNILKWYDMITCMQL